MSIKPHLSAAWLATTAERRERVMSKRCKHLIWMTWCLLALIVLPVTSSGAEIRLTATLQTISVSVDADTVDFGILVASDSTVSSSSITVTNSGNDNATYSLSVANSSNWTAGSSVDANQFSLSCMFNSVAPSMGDFHTTDDRLSTSPVTCSTSNFAGDQDGEDVAASAALELWFKFQAPSSSSVQTEELITVTVTAAAAS
jgi:hypothetical protein